MLEAFKEAHKEREQLLSTGGKTAELRGDLAVMEREREIVASKVASLQKTRVRLYKSSYPLKILISIVPSRRRWRARRRTRRCWPECKP